MKLVAVVDVGGGVVYINPEKVIVLSGMEDGVTRINVEDGLFVRTGEDIKSVAGRLEDVG